ncbi:MAG: MaoC family dehydratase [Dehalococcoidia bacterium]|jgi:hypothetical protein|nr:MaoC family dehydratase [Dehalococcoidia bacterium]|tara:strand:+ start:389 stop:835 length:447 start_codon:yes stop_codon:yes gene_type:complete
MVNKQLLFSDIELGQEFSDTYIASAEKVQQFLDANRTLERTEIEDGRFTSKEGASTLGLEKPILPGVMSMSIISKLITDIIAPNGKLHKLDASFRRPVFHNDSLSLSALVVDTVIEEDKGIIKLDVALENDRGEKPLQGTAVVELPIK